MPCPRRALDRRQTISGTVQAAAGEAAVGDTVTLYDNSSTTPLGTATVTGGVRSTTVTLLEGSDSVVAKDTDAAGNVGTRAVAYTLQTMAPTVTIISTGGPTSQASQMISGTVTAAAGKPRSAAR